MQITQISFMVHLYTKMPTAPMTHIEFQNIKPSDLHIITFP